MLATDSAQLISEYLTKEALEGFKHFKTGVQVICTMNGTCPCATCSERYSSVGYDC